MQARPACSVSSTEEADADTLPRLPGGDVRADRIDHANHLVPRDGWEGDGGMDGPTVEVDPANGAAPRMSALGLGCVKTIQ